MCSATETRCELIFDIPHRAAKLRRETRLDGRSVVLAKWVYQSEPSTLWQGAAVGCSGEERPERDPVTRRGAGVEPAWLTSVDRGEGTTVQGARTPMASTPPITPSTRPRGSRANERAGTVGAESDTNGAVGAGGAMV